MGIALIEPYLVDYTGHFYNFITELKRGFLELYNRYIVDIFASENCIIDESFLKMLPEIKNLNGKNHFAQILLKKKIAVPCHIFVHARSEAL